MRKPPRIASLEDTIRPFWLDTVVGVSALLIMLGCLALQVLIGGVGSVASIYSSAEVHSRTQGNFSAWAGFSLILGPFAIWGFGELAASRMRGHAIGGLFGAFAVWAYTTDHLIWGWLLLAPLPVYCGARLAGWGPRTL